MQKAKTLRKIAALTVSPHSIKECGVYGVAQNDVFVISAIRCGECRNVFYAKSKSDDSKLKGKRAFKCLDKVDNTRYFAVVKKYIVGKQVAVYHAMSRQTGHLVKEVGERLKRSVFAKFFFEGAYISKRRVFGFDILRNGVHRRQEIAYLLYMGGYRNV